MNGRYFLKRNTYAQSFHTYTLEWTENFIRASVDSRTHAMLLTQTKTDKASYWKKAGFPATATNGSSGATVAVEDVWINGTRAAPFDKGAHYSFFASLCGTGTFADVRRLCRFLLNHGPRCWRDERMVPG